MNEISGGALIKILLSCKGRSKFFDEPGPGVTLRHDVDNDLEASVMLATIQHELGIKATYFILDTAPYWDVNSDEMWAKIQTIADLGHRIEWHNNTITRALKGYLFDPEKSVKEYALESLNEFRSRGFNVTGSAAHGDSLCREHQYVNWQIFTECVNPAHPISERLTKYLPNFTPFSMKEIGLEWEAYYMPYTEDHYFSEPGGRWKNPVDLDALEDPEKRSQILIHPQWWGL